VSGLVEAARYGTTIEAEIARTYLASHGIEAVVFDGASSLYSDGAMINARLMVLEDDFERARVLLLDRL
jgi:hypothetical protein